MTDLLFVIPNPTSDRQRYFLAFKPQIAEGTLLSGTSIAGVALLHGINAYLLHIHRTLYQHDEYDPVVDHSTLLLTRLPAPHQDSFN